jgi:hypothetical protein
VHADADAAVRWPNAAEAERAAAAATTSAASEIFMFDPLSL